MTISSKGLVLVNPREEGGVEARRQINLTCGPSRSGSNITNSEIPGIHIAMVHLCITHFLTPSYTPPNTHILQSPLQQLNWVFQVEFCDSEEVRLLQEQRTKEMLKTEKHFYQPTWNVVCFSPICWKHWKAFPNISNICWVRPNAPSLLLHPPSLYPSSLILKWRSITTCIILYHVPQSRARAGAVFSPLSSGCARWCRRNARAW